MPSYISQSFTALLLDLLAGTAQPPQTLYLGLGTGQSGELATTYGANLPSGYTRIAVSASSLKINQGTLTLPPASWTFNCYLGAANAWQLYSAPSGGILYAAGPLNPAPVNGPLLAPLAPNSGQTTLPIAASEAALLTVGDTLRLGNNAERNLEYPTFGGYNAAGAAIIGSVMYAHPQGEPWQRDGQTRIFSQGWTETVTPTISITAGP